MVSVSKPLVLIILDGWGIAPPGPGNAITQAKLPNFNQYWQSFPHAQLRASGSAVGLPEGADGNSEVGHLNLGAGRIVRQDVLRIDQSINNGSFFQNQAFLEAINYARDHQSHLHLMGLIGEGIVHASNNHLFALLKLCREQNFKKVLLHLFTDGRDSPPRSALNSLKALQEVISQTGVGQIVSVSGRYYAMDRDQRWDRTQRAYQALTEGIGQIARSAEEAIQKAYQRNESDEFIQPTLITNDQQSPLGLIKNNDAVIFYNFRIDRPRQLTKALVSRDKVRAPFPRRKILQDLFFVTMTDYEKGLPVKVAFSEQPLTSTLGEVISQANLKQLRAAESEKERFVTYYFNGFRQSPFPGEARLIVPSPSVATYDLQPEMSAYLLVEKFIEKLTQENYDLAIINFANPDMVAHTANLSSTIKAVEAVDECLGGLVEFILNQNGTVLITADHGNAEELIDTKSGSVDSEHSTSDVPFILLGKNWQEQPIELTPGILGDVAPTILELLHLPKPEVMTGKSLVGNLKP